METFKTKAYEFCINMAIGGPSAVISRTLTAPLELLKIQQQNRFLPNTTLHEVFEKEGITGLWKGNLANTIRIFPQSAINFACFQFAKTYVFSWLETQPTLMNFFSGTFAGIVSMASIYPLENIRSRLSLQTNKTHYHGVVDVFRKTPIKTLYNGLGMSLIGFAPYNALNFMFYNLFKDVGGSFHMPASFIQLLAGGFAGMSAVSFTYPTDLIRRRLQLQGFDTRVPKYKGILDCAYKIYTTEGGIYGLYRGLGACYIKIFPAIAIQFWMMETLTTLIQSQSKQRAS